MDRQRIVVLGGYGGTGAPLVRLLLEKTEARIVIAGRHKERAEALAQQLNATVAGQRAEACLADAADEDSLRRAFAGATLVVVATTTPQHAQRVARVAIASGADYLDYHFEQRTVERLRALEPEIVQAGRCFITQAGFHPGLPAPLVRYAARYFDRYRTATIGMAMTARGARPESLYELIDSMHDYKREVFRDGRWQNGRITSMPRLDLGRRFGVRSCYPLWMEELRALPEQHGLEELGLYIAGFNWVSDYLIFPCAFALQAIRPGLARHQLARALSWAVNRDVNAEGVAIRLLASGERQGRHIRVSLLLEHPDPYLFTAIPVLACIRQYLDGSIRAPGVYLMGARVEPERLLHDIEELGIAVELQVSGEQAVGASGAHRA